MKILSSLVVGILAGGLVGAALFNQAILPKAEAGVCRQARAECVVNNTEEPCCEGFCIPFNASSGNGKCGTETGDHHFICSANACIPTDGAGSNACTSDTECATPPPTAVCGNNIVEAGETCDDGNITDLDGCSSTCQTEAQTATPTPTPTPVQITTTTTTGGPGDGLSDGRSDGLSSCPSCTAPPSGAVLGVSTEGGQVLGASTDTLGATGSNYQMARMWIAATAALVIFLLGHTLVRGNETS